MNKPRGIFWRNKAAIKEAKKTQWSLEELRAPSLVQFYEICKARDSRMEIIKGYDKNHKLVFKMEKYKPFFQEK